MDLSLNLTFFLVFQHCFLSFHIPLFTTIDLGNGHHTAFITALHGGTMLVTVNFNKHIIPNCPFKVIAIDGMIASGEGPEVVMVGKVGTFTIHTNHPPISSNAIPLNVHVISMYHLFIGIFKNLDIHH